jgi:membrane protein DedA with SNARE-associated domain
LLRIFASPMAGVAEMPLLKFLGVNLASSVSWATVMTGLAFTFGKFVSLEQLIGWISQFAIVALLIAAAWIVVPIWLESRNAKLEE